MKQRNNYSLGRESRLARFGHYLRKRLERPWRIFYRRAFRSAADAFGTGAVTLLLMWFGIRR